PDYRDADAYRREATHGSTLGCVGKWAIHPDQVPIANEVFAPTEKEIALAKRMVDAYKAAQSGGAGAGSASGVSVDAATVRIFQAVLDRQALVQGSSGRSTRDNSLVPPWPGS